MALMMQLKTNSGTDTQITSISGIHDYKNKTSTILSYAFFPRSKIEMVDFGLTPGNGPQLNVGAGGGLAKPVDGSGPGGGAAGDFFSGTAFW